jgi:hypothetical protein
MAQFSFVPVALAVIAGVFALDDVREAFRQVELRHTRGKLEKPPNGAASPKAEPMLMILPQPAFTMRLPASFESSTTARTFRSNCLS